MISVIADHNAEITWVKIFSISMSSLFFAFLVCHEAGIRNIGTSVSTSVEVILSTVEIRNEINLYDIYFDFHS